MKEILLTAGLAALGVIIGAKIAGTVGAVAGTAAGVAAASVLTRKQQAA